MHRDVNSLAVFEVALQVNYEFCRLAAYIA